MRTAVSAWCIGARWVLRGALVGAVVIGLSAPAQALCIARTEQQHFAAADVVFEAIALEGPRAPSGETLLSPATFEVLTYLKGDGPGRIEVTTAEKRSGKHFVVISDGIYPKPGEVWRIYGRRGTTDVIQTSQCDGSRLVPDAGGRALPPRPEPTRIPIGLIVAVAVAGALAAAALVAIRSGRRRAA